MADDIDAGSNPASEDTRTPAPETEAPGAGPSTRDALAKAFESTFGKERDEPEAKPAPKDDRPRDEHGKFAPKDKAESDAKAPEKPVEAKPAEAAPVEAPKVDTPTIAAPSRFTPEAKAAFEAAPPALRSEIARLESELTKGIAEYKDRFEPIKRFDEMARSGGTTLDKALSAYVGMENAWRKDPAQGFVAVAQNMGLDPAQLAVAIAQKITGKAEIPAGQGQYAAEAALRAEIADLKAQVQGVGKTYQTDRMTAQVEQFAADKPRFNDLAPQIEQLLQSPLVPPGTPVERLAKAYELAEKLSPAPAAPPPPAPAPAPAPAAAAPATPPAAQTRKGSLSLTGSPSGSNPTQRTPAGSSREAVQRALSQVGL